MKYVIGIDGGGTKTQAVLLDPTGRELGRGRGGAANPNTVGREATAAAMRQAVQTALMTASKAAGPSPRLEEIAGVGVGMAGVTGAQTWLAETLSQVLPGAVVISTHDAEIALIGALGVQHGIVAIAGTGSAIYGRSAAGDSALADAWGYLLGDEASGFAIGRAAVQVFLHVLDGRAAPCALAEAVGAQLKLSTREAIVAWAYPRDKSGGLRANVPGIAGLAAVVMEQAASGDTTAQAIIDAAADALVLSIGAVRRRLSLGRCEVGLAGGVLRSGGPMAEAATIKLAARLPGVTPVAPRSDAATGAAWLAMAALGWREL
ncbi:MAG: hypothetical protein JXB47_10915 [Anaerolineae bacterium]|nr:hypothetical protein [Anaerolineae bacterium]